MGFMKWLMKKGAIGGAARLMIKAYRKEKKRNPNASDKEIFESIAKWRYSITGEHLSHGKLDEMIQSSSLRDFVHKIVTAERSKDMIRASDRAIHDVIDVINEVCDEEGI